MTTPPPPKLIEAMARAYLVAYVNDLEDNEAAGGRAIQAALTAAHARRLRARGAG